MGSVRRRKDREDQWEISFYGPTGRRFRELVDAKSKAEAQQALALRMTEEAATATRSDLTLGSLLEQWAKATSRTEIDKTRARRFVESIGAEKLVAQVRTKDVNRFLDSRVAIVAATSAARELAAISAMFRWAIRRGEISINPVVGCDRPSAAYDPPADVPEADIPRILEAVRGDQVLEPAFLLALVQGMRRGEIAAAQWEDVDVENRTIRVRGTKTVHSAAAIPIFEPALTWLKANKRDAGFIVRSKRGGDGLLPTSLQLAINHFNARKVRPIELPNLHRCRHTCATILAKRGVPEHMVTAFLRWKNSRMFATVYRHYQATHFRDHLGAIEKAF